MRLGCGFRREAAPTLVLAQATLDLCVDVERNPTVSRVEPSIVRLAVASRELPLPLKDMVHPPNVDLLVGPERTISPTPVKVAPMATVRLAPWAGTRSDRTRMRPA